MPKRERPLPDTGWTKEVKALYARIRSGRRYLPTWRNLTQAELDAVEDLHVAQLISDQDLAGRIYTGRKPKEKAHGRR